VAVKAVGLEHRDMLFRHPGAHCLLGMDREGKEAGGREDWEEGAESRDVRLQCERFGLRGILGRMPQNFLGLTKDYS